MISSLTNSKVKLVRRLQTGRRARHREGKLVLEGARLVREALVADKPLDFVFYTAGWAKTPAGATLLDAVSRTGCLLSPVSDAVMASCADTNTPQGVLAVLPFPRFPLPAEPTFILVVDRLRIPGNLGTILRTAAAAGVELVILPPGNVDHFAPKVVRGGMGAHFRLPVLRLGWAETEARLAGLDVWLAAAGKGTQYNEVDWTRPLALIVGGEARGASERAQGMATGRVLIPMPGGVESLNTAVAAGVLLFEVVRQREDAGRRISSVSGQPG